MSEPFLAEIRIVGFNFAPRGWALCDGQLLPINQNQALFSLLGTTYGGDGRTTFALPDLRGRVPIHEGPDDVLGDKGGEESHALEQNEMPAHDHAMHAVTADAVSGHPTGRFSAYAEEEIYASPSGSVPMHASAVAPAGQNEGHNNMQPYLTLNFVIALRGLFPSRS